MLASLNVICDLAKQGWRFKVQGEEILGKPPTDVDVEGERKDGKGPVYFKKGGTKFTVPSKESGGNRIVKSPDNENPTGQWNTIELYTVGQTSVHLVNGKVNMILTGSRQKVDGKEVPLTKGKIQIQSEGAEVFYRNITIRPIEVIPPELLK